MSLNIIFCGSPDFSCEALETLIKIPTDKTITVITQPDKIRKRGNKIQPTPVKTLAIKHQLPTYSPQSKEEFENCVKAIHPDIIIVIAYAMIIPKTITDSYLCVNAHTSLLPKYRGASPIQAAILNQDKETGICFIHMNEKMDEGNIIAKQTVPISQTTTYGDLHNKLASITASMVKDLIQNVLQNIPLKSSPQDHTQASYCSKILPSDYKLNPQENIQITLAKIKAYSPKPGAYIIHNNKHIKILDATIESDTLIPTIVQPEGKKPMAYTDYLLGNKEKINLC